MSQRMETESCLERLSPQQKKWWLWDSFQIGHYCSFWLRLWLQTSKPDLGRVKPLCHVNLFHQPQMQTALLLSYPEQWWCWERFSSMTWKQCILTGKLNFVRWWFAGGTQDFSDWAAGVQNPNLLHPQIHYKFPFPWGITGFLHSHFYNNFFECFW